VVAAAEQQSAAAAVATARQLHTSFPSIQPTRRPSVRQTAPS